VCDQAGMKISTKKTVVLCLSRNPMQCILQVIGNKLQQVETFKHLGVAFSCDGIRNRRFIHELVKLTQFCVSFIALW